MRIGGGCGFKNVQPNFVRGTFYIGKIDEYCTPFPKTLENAFSKDHKTSLAAEEMQLIRPTSEFKVGHLPFQGKVKGILPRWGRSKPSRLRRDWSLSNCDVLSPDFQGRRPVLTLLRQEKVGNFCFLKISRMSCISTSAARFYGFSSNEVRFKGVRARPVGGAGDGVA